MVESEYRQALPRGHLVESYRLLDVLGVGGFGLTYLAENVRAGGLVALKEYLPGEFAVRAGKLVAPKSAADQPDFEWGLARFMDEADTLARLQHPNIVEVLDYFEANDTAYIGMRYEEGLPLDRLLQERGPLSESLLKRLLMPLADGLGEVHAAGFLHRDIKPSNVYVRRTDESPVLLDFGSARQALGRRSRTLTAVVSPGYSPPEQYESDGDQGAWSDIYALAAMCYRAITAEKPVVSLRRQRMRLADRPDPMESLEAMAPEGYSRALLGAVDWGLQLQVHERPQNVTEWVAVIATGTRPSGRRPSRVQARRAPPRPAPRMAVGARIRIGRARDADVRIDSQGVSRAHAELTIEDSGSYLISDLGSTNGTFVFRGGRWVRVHSERVEAEARLRVGDFETTPMELESIAKWPAPNEGDNQVSHPLAAGPATGDDPEHRPAGVRVRRNPSTGEVVGE